MAHFNSTAYVQMALHGTSLHQSLLAATQLLQRHRRRMHDCQGAAHAAVMPGKVGTTTSAEGPQRGVCMCVWGGGGGFVLIG